MNEKVFMLIKDACAKIQSTKTIMEIFEAQIKNLIFMI
jgi:hypothetical protein